MSGSREFLNFKKKTDKWSTGDTKKYLNMLSTLPCTSCAETIQRHFVKTSKQDVNIGPFRASEDPSTQALAASVLREHWGSEIITAMKVHHVCSIVCFY